MKFFLFLRELFVLSCYRGIFSYILLQVLVVSLSYQTIFLMSPWSKLQQSLVQNSSRVCCICQGNVLRWRTDRQMQGDPRPDLCNALASNSRVNYIITHITEHYIYLIKKHCLYFLDYGRKQIVPSMIFSTVDIMHFLSYRKMFRACGPSTISYRMEVHYIHSRKYHLGTICIILQICIFFNC